MTLKFWISFPTFGYFGVFQCRFFFPFHEKDALRVLSRAYSSCALLWRLVHISFLITPSVLMTPKCILSPDLYPQAADLHILSISGHLLLDYSYSLYMQT